MAKHAPYNKEKKMTVWHMGPYKIGHKANGVAVVTEMLIDQLVINELNVSFFKSTYRMLLRIAFSKKSSLPTLIHFHSCKVLVQSFIGIVCRLKGVKYVVQPHGGYYPGLDYDDSWFLKCLKKVYLSSIELLFLKGATHLIATQSEEKNMLAEYFRVDRNIIDILNNPVKNSTLFGDISRDLRRIVYIGRFAMHHKGIDRIIDIAGLLPEFSFELYGAKDVKQIEELELKYNLPLNLKIKTGIFGPEKKWLLQSSGFFIQMSRFEACATASLEALSNGLPVLLVSDMAMAEYVTANERGIVLDKEVDLAAEQIRECRIVADVTFHKRVNNWIDKELSPEVIAHQLYDIYLQCIL